MIHLPGDPPSQAELDKAVGIHEQHQMDWALSTLGRGTMNNSLFDGCNCSGVPEAPAVATHAGQAKNRYLSILPNNPGQQTALRVTLTASTTFPSAVGKQWWVGAPLEVCDGAGQIVPPAGGCGPAPGIPKRTMWSSTLDCNQHCLDWHSLVDAAGNPLDVLHIGDPDVATGSVYDIQAVDCTCDKTDPNNYSAPLPVPTAKWGDTVGLTIAGCPNSDPNGGLIVLILDCVAIVNKFSNLPCAPLKSRVDIDPSDTNLKIDFSDVVECLGAFGGGGFPYSAPVGCP